MHAGGMLMAARDATPPPPLPTQPTGLTASPVSSTAVDLSWTDTASDEDSYEVQWSEESDFSVIAGETTGLAANTQAYTVTGLTAGGTTYYFRVRAINLTGNGPYSASATATTPGVTPDAPTNVSAVMESATACSMWWFDESDEHEFEVEIYLASVGAGSPEQQDTVSAGVETYDFTGLDAGDHPDTYHCRVRSKYTSGPSAGAVSPWVEATVASIASSPSSPDSGVPADNALAVVDDTELTQTWTDNAGPDNVIVQIARDASFTQDVQTATVLSTVETKSWTGLVPDTTYYCRVRARTSDDTSAWSATANAKTDPDTVPNAVTGHSVTAAATTTLDHGWTDPVEPPTLTEVDVEIWSAGGGGQLDTDTVAKATETKQWTSLTEGTEYQLRVFGVNPAGNGASNNIAAYTQLAAPTSLSNTVDQGISWVLEWTDNSGNVDTWVIERDTGGGFVQVGTTPNSGPDATKYVVTKSSGVQWRIKGRTTNYPDSAYSNTFTDPS